MKRFANWVLGGWCLLSCSSGQPAGDPPPREAPPADPAAEGPAHDAPAAAAARWDGPAAFLPRPEVAGYQVTAAGPRFFDASNLYTYMNGQSDSYIEYGIAKLAIAEYHPTGGSAQRTVQVELYDMATKLGAFGRWSRLAVEGGDPVQIADRFVELGGGGIASGTDLAFWKGQYLAKLTYLDESPDATEESLRSAARTVLLPIARALADKLPGDGAPPTELARLPAAGLVPHSQVRYGRALLGLDALGPGFGSEYLVNGKRMRLFFAERATEAEATAGYDALKGGLSAAAPLAGLADAAVKGTDPQRGEVVVARKGNLVLIVTNSDTPEAPAGDEAAKVALARALLGG